MSRWPWRALCGPLPALRARRTCNYLARIVSGSCASVKIVSDTDGASSGTLNDSRVPAQGKDAFDCPRCATFARQEWFDLERFGGSFRDGRPGRGKSGKWTTAQCNRCERFSVWRDDRLIYPMTGVAPLAHPHMPQEARELYDEAREVLGISRRAGAALARAALERLLRTLDPDAGRVNLATRIERIFPRVPAPLGQMLTVIRVVGNATLHVGDEPDEMLVLILDPAETEIVELIFEAINDLVEELIAKPSKVGKLYEKIPATIRARVESALAEGATTTPQT